MTTDPRFNLPASLYEARYAVRHAGEWIAAIALALTLAYCSTS